MAFFSRAHGSIATVVQNTNTIVTSEPSFSIDSNAKKNTTNAEDICCNFHHRSVDKATTNRSYCGCYYTDDDETQYDFLDDYYCCCIRVGAPSIVYEKKPKDAHSISSSLSCRSMRAMQISKSMCGCYCTDNEPTRDFFEDEYFCHYIRWGRNNLDDTLSYASTQRYIKPYDLPFEETSPSLSVASYHKPRKTVSHSAINPKQTFIDSNAKSTKRNTVKIKQESIDLESKDLEPKDLASKDVKLNETRPQSTRSMVLYTQRCREAEILAPIQLMASVATNGVLPAPSFKKPSKPLLINGEPINQKPQAKSSNQKPSDTLQYIIDKIPAATTGQLAGIHGTGGKNKGGGHRSINFGSFNEPPETLSKFVISKFKDNKQKGASTKINSRRVNRIK